MPDGKFSHLAYIEGAVIPPSYEGIQFVAVSGQFPDASNDWEVSRCQIGPGTIWLGDAPRSVRCEYCDTLGNVATNCRNCGARL